MRMKIYALLRELKAEIKKLVALVARTVFFATPNYQKMQNAFPKVAAGNSSFLHVPPA